MLVMKAEQTMVVASTGVGAAEAEMVMVPDALYNWPSRLFHATFIVGQHVCQDFESNSIVG